jgi:aminocarboxymuconate-semialdehyde decarboxylase
MAPETVSGPVDRGDEAVRLYLQNNRKSASSRDWNSLKLDVHNHAIPRAAIELLQSNPTYGIKTDGIQWSGGSHANFMISRALVDPAAKLAQLEQKGLDGAVVSPAPPLFFYDVNTPACEAMCHAVNNGLAEFCQAQPDRLHWIAHVPMQDPTLAATLLAEARLQGCVGVEIATSIAGRRLDAEEFTPFWEAVDDLGIAVMIHPSYNETHLGLNDFYLDNVIGNLLETTVAIERLICSGHLDRFPRIKILLVHGGGFFPYGAGRLRHAIQVRPELSAAPKDPLSYRNRLFFDTVTHNQQALRFLVSLVGAPSIVIGTDLPFDMATPDPIGELTAAVSSEEGTLIAERNPVQLFGLDQ